jgi:hypothetical protein
MVRRGRGRGRRTVRNPRIPHGQFVRGSSDPPSATVSTWKSIRLSFEVQPGSVSNITTSLIGTELGNIGINAQAIKLIKISAYGMSGTAANQSRPSVELDVYNPLTAASYGTRLDTGSLSVPAHLHFAFPQHQRDSPVSLTSTAYPVATIEITGSPSGTCVISLSYLI